MASLFVQSRQSRSSSFKFQSSRALSMPILQKYSRLKPTSKSSTSSLKRRNFITCLSSDIIQYPTYDDQIDYFVYSYLNPILIGYQDHGDSTFPDRRYGGHRPVDAALVIQRAYRRYSMVKEFQRIKTERRLSRRINNNVVGSSSSPPVNSCDICIEVHPNHTHTSHHQHPQDLHLDTLEDGLESSSMPLSMVTGTQSSSDLPEVTEVQLAVDQQQLMHHPSNNQNQQHQHQYHQYQYQHQQHVQVQYHQNQYHHPHPQKQYSSSGSNLRNPQYTHPPTTYTNMGGSRGHHTHSSTSRLPSDVTSTSRQQAQQLYHLQQQQRQNIPNSQSQIQQNHHSHGSLLMVKPHSQPQLLGVNCSESSVSNSTTPLTNVSPNLSTSSMNSQNSSASGKILSSEESEIIRKRLYRVGLNMFNKKPEQGVQYLVKKKFLEGSPPSVARFLVSRKGLSKQMIGEYLTNLQSPFSMSCLEHFVNEIDLSSLPVDLGLRKFQSYYRMPGEAQKIERLMEAFSRRYAACNSHVVSQFRNGADTVFVLAFAIIMLNTDLHTPHLKADRRMKLDDFVKNLRGVDDGGDIDKEILVGIYDRIKSTEFKTGSDHVTQVMKVQQTIVGKKPNLAVPHRRLVCYCRLYEVPDVAKKEKTGCHQREVFLFNDLLVLTKIFHKKRNSVTYSFRQSYPLGGLTLQLFSNQFYEYGLSLRRGDAVLLNLNARNEHDRAKFTEDLREAIAESDEMTRIESLSKENRDRDSGVDVGKIKRFSNSLLDINDQCKPVRRGSCGSLDSGMSVSFQSDENHPHQTAQGPIPITNGTAASGPLQPQNFQHVHQGSTCSSGSSSSQNSHK